MAASRAFVIDASLVTELFIPGPAANAADRFFLDAPERYELIAPHIIVGEVAAALTRGVRRGALKPLDARIAFADWQEMLDDQVIGIKPSDDLLSAAFDLSLRLRHPLHDCVYVALALSESAGIAMCDATLAKKCRDLGIQTEVIVSSA